LSKNRGHNKEGGKRYGQLTKEGGGRNHKRTKVDTIGGILKEKGKRKKRAIKKKFDLKGATRTIKIDRRGKGDEGGKTNITSADEVIVKKHI